MDLAWPSLVDVNVVELFRSLQFLEDQLREVDERADMGEREIVKLENFVQNYYNELDTWKKKLQSVKDEVSSLVSQYNGLL